MSSEADTYHITIKLHAVVLDPRNTSQRLTELIHTVMSVTLDQISTVGVAYSTPVVSVWHRSTTELEP